VNNNSNFAFRIVAELENTAANTANTNYVGAAGTYGISGTVRFDMMTISGSSIPTNNTPLPATLSAFSYASNGFQFQLTGSAGLNYVIQTSTNLSANNWTSIFTNVAPFTFVDSNATNDGQRFYRAAAAP
jgi:hypothetical protein